jgi:hypothetical protein
MHSALDSSENPKIQFHYETTRALIISDSSQLSAKDPV